MLTVDNTTHRANVLFEGVAKLRSSLGSQSPRKATKPNRWFGVPLEESMKINPHITQHIIDYLCEHGRNDVNVK